MINLFERSNLFLKIAIIVFAVLLVFLLFLIVLGWRMPWFALAWQQAPSPQQVGMLRWNQQGLPISITPEVTPVDVTAADVAFDGNKLWITYSRNEASKDIDGFVVPYDPHTGKWGDQVPVGKKPSGIVFDGRLLWVANRGSKNLSCIDPTVENPEEAPWELKDGNDETAGSPNYLAFDGENIWVTDFIEGNTEGDTGGALWRLPASSCGRPESEYADTRIIKLNGKDDAFIQPFGIIFDGTYIWVANQGSNEVMRLDPGKCSDEECTGVRIINVGSEPSHLTYDGTFVWVTLNGTNSDQVARIHARSGQKFGKLISLTPNRKSDQPTTAPPPKPEPNSKTSENGKLDGIAFDGKYIWIASSTSWVCQLLARDATPVSEFCIFGNKENACANYNGTASRIAFDGTFIWIIISDGEASSLYRR